MLDPHVQGERESRDVRLNLRRLNLRILALAARLPCRHVDSVFACPHADRLSPLL